MLGHYLNAESPLAKVFSSRKISTPMPGYAGGISAISPLLGQRMKKDIDIKNKQRFKAVFRNPSVSIIRKIEIAGNYGILNEGQF